MLKDSIAKVTAVEQALNAPMPDQQAVAGGVQAGGRHLRGVPQAVSRAGREPAVPLKAGSISARPNSNSRLARSSGRTTERSGVGGWQLGVDSHDYNPEPHPIGCGARHCAAVNRPVVREGYQYAKALWSSGAGVVRRRAATWQRAGSADSRGLSGKMKAAAQANGELQKALKAGVAADAVAPAKAASAAFADIEKFWKAQKKDDAVKLAAQARRALPTRQRRQRRATRWRRRWLPGTRRTDVQAVPLGCTAKATRRPASSSRPALSRE